MLQGFSRAVSGIGLCGFAPALGATRRAGAPFGRPDIETTMRWGNIDDRWY
jgi:hypothetical protein